MDVKMDFVNILVDNALSDAKTYYYLIAKARKAHGLKTDNSLYFNHVLTAEERYIIERANAYANSARNTLDDFCNLSGIDVGALEKIWKAMRRAGKWDLMCCGLGKYESSIIRSCKA